MNAAVRRTVRRPAFQPFRQPLRQPLLLQPNYRTALYTNISPEITEQSIDPPR